MTMAGNIKPMEAGRRPFGVMGQDGQLSDECSCGHVDLLLCPLALLAMSADVAFCLGIKTSLSYNKLEKRNKHEQQMYGVTNSENMAIVGRPRLCSVVLTVGGGNHKKQDNCFITFLKINDI